MANFTLFRSLGRRLGIVPDATNQESAPAYAFDDRHALAQVVATGTLSNTFYATAESQLDDVLGLCDDVDDRFVAQCAVYGRRTAGMKDLPALLVAVLAARRSPRFAAAFREVIDNGRMLRNFVQIVRSGRVGRRSFGSAPRRLIRDWLAGRSDGALLRASVGNDPSLADIVKMVHPRPETDSRRALYGWLLGKEYDSAALPQVVRDLEAFRGGDSDAVPDVPFLLLTSLPLTQEHWRGIARTAGWHATRMNLNTFVRHGVFDGEDGEITRLVAKRLADGDEVLRARVFPYQLLAAYRYADAAVPRRVVDALHTALEHATANVPRVPGRVVVCPDVSGSMQSPVTGWRPGQTTSVRCVDVAALIAAVFLRQRDDTLVLPFEHQVCGVPLDARRSVLENADLLAQVGGGGTAVSAPLRWLNETEETADLVILVSDNESWFDEKRGWGGAEATQAVDQWRTFRVRNPRARLVCLDIQPYGTTQVPDRPGVLNIGGFSDSVFDVIARFAAGDDDAQRWVREIERVSLPA